MAEEEAVERGEGTDHNHRGPNPKCPMLLSHTIIQWPFPLLTPVIPPLFFILSPTLFETNIEKKEEEEELLLGDLLVLVNEMGCPEGAGENVVFTSVLWLVVWKGREDGKSVQFSQPPESRLDAMVCAVSMSKTFAKTSMPPSKIMNALPPSSLIHFTFFFHCPSVGPITTNKVHLLLQLTFN